MSVVVKCRTKGAAILFLALTPLPAKSKYIAGSYCRRQISNLVFNVLVQKLVQAP